MAAKSLTGTAPASSGALHLNPADPPPQLCIFSLFAPPDFLSFLSITTTKLQKSSRPLPTHFHSHSLHLQTVLICHFIKMADEEHDHTFESADAGASTVSISLSPRNVAKKGVGHAVSRNILTRIENPDLSYAMLVSA